MASKSLGTLTIDLIAKVGGFVSGMDRAERSSEQWRRKVEANIKATGAVLAGMVGIAASASAAVGAVGIAFLKNTSEQITETDRWAKSLGISTQRLLEWQYAAKQAGLTGDNIADIFKDLNDKIGDAVLNNSGEAAGALDTLRLSAKKLQEVSPDKQLLAIADAMKGMNTAQKTNILESLGNDLSKMLPLFDNGNEKLNQFLKQARDMGVAPPQEDIDKLVEVNSIFQEIEASWDGFKTKMAVGLADIDLKPLVDSVQTLEKIFTDPEVLQGIANMATGLTKVVGLLAQGARLANDMAYGWGKTASTTNDSSFNELLAKRKELNESLAYSESFLGRIDSAAGVIRSSEQIRAEIAKNEQLISSFDDMSRLPLQQAVVAENPYSLGTGETNGKPAKPKKNNAALKQDNAFKATEQAYLKQIALIDTTGKKTAEVTEAQKLQFDIADGKLAGINEAQKSRLAGLAAEVDRLNAVKKASVEMAKVAEFTANLSAGNQNAREDLSVDVQGAGLGDKQRDRMKERLSIERSFLDQQRQLQLSYQSGDITKSLYDSESSALKSAMSDRLSIQEDYYKSVDAMQSDWMSGMSDGLANWLNESSNYSEQTANIVSSSMGSALDNVADMLTGNKASWKDWMTSVLSMIAKVALQMAAVNLVSGIVSSVGGAVAGGAAGGASVNNAFSGGAYNNLSLNAMGGVYASSDLSSYSGQIVSSPTMFAFAKGAGLMGEAGPEAIMPLTRGADGKLGVRATGGTSNGGTNISVSVGELHFGKSGGGNGAVADTSGIKQQLKETIVYAISEQVQKPGTPLWKAINGRG